MELGNGECMSNSNARFVGCLALQDQAVQEALVVLSNAVTYAFQQAFYPVGKVCNNLIIWL